ncbi:hypothetical protein [Chondromyces crocatus]|uniref:Uncharacterized protein n=1 Tax=Chondromyces crocatus TaxID=52 RepID=A0A0K1ECB9_CHOCO|nr:hypothetical protein [Chondromyces crocatus]AKT38327.1 uncharacterized protein CMC5_024720 [Chondromyces crocatus]
MIERLCAHLVVPDGEDVLTLLFEVLSVDFEDCGGTWKGEMFGGTTYSVIPDPKIDGHYELIVLTDRSHPNFAAQQKVFGDIKRFPDWFTRVLAREGVVCTWGTSEDAVG